MTSVALYIRVSTDRQDSSNQLPQLERVCQERGWTIAAIFSEDATAWHDGHQSELAKLLREVKTRRRKYDNVLLWALDRLTRGGPEAVLSLVHTFQLYGVKVCSYQEPWLETAGPTTDLLLSITGWIAQQESVRRSERTRAALDKKRAAGVRLGRPPGARDKQKRRKKRPVVFKFGGVNVA